MVRGKPLDKKERFPIEDIRLGSINNANASLSENGEIIWNKKSKADYYDFGWALTRTDLSQYAGLRIEMAPNQKQDVTVKIRNRLCDDEWCFTVKDDGIVYAFFDGSGKSWGNMQVPPKGTGYTVLFTVPAKKYKKTVIKSVELIKKEDVPSYPSELELMGKAFGSVNIQSHIIGNTIIWAQGSNDCSAGWYLYGIDLSEYNKVRIELEDNEIEKLNLVLADNEWDNWTVFEEVEPNVFEADLSGENRLWGAEKGIIDRSQGMLIFFHPDCGDKPLYKYFTTTVKSVELIK